MEQTTMFNPVQQHLLKMFAFDGSEARLLEVKTVLTSTLCRFRLSDIPIINSHNNSVSSVPLVSDAAQGTLDTNHCLSRKHFLEYNLRQGSS